VAQEDVHDYRMAEISTGLIEVHRINYGTTPSEVTTYSEDGLTICKMKGVTMAVEKTLRGGGHDETARDIRRKAQNASSPTCVEVVEHATGRTVLAHMSTSDSDTDLGYEVFVFDHAD
jgi:uncharacterized protein YbcI